MKALTLLALCACNQVLGIKNTEPRDASVDAPFACPEIGKGPPAFSTTLHQQVVQDCT